MPTLTETIKLPGDVDPATVRTTVQLWGAGEPVTGFDFGTDKSIAGPRVVTGNPWTVTDLVGNADIDAPTGTVYKVTRQWPGLTEPLVDYVDMPTTGGPYQLGDRLTDPPAAIESSALALHKADTTTAHGIDTKVAKAGDTMTGPLVLQSDLTVAGELKTGTFGSPPTFKGIEREAVFFPAGAAASPTGIINFGDKFPRIYMPAGETTDAYFNIEIEEWWLRVGGSAGFYFEWVNDHSATGNVRWETELLQCKIGTAVASAGVLASRSMTEASPAANVMTTSIVASVANGNPVDLGDPGPLASAYVLRISRLGGHADNTLAGPVGLFGASMTRGQ